MLPIPGSSEQEQLSIETMSDEQLEAALNPSAQAPESEAPADAQMAPKDSAVQNPEQPAAPATATTEEQPPDKAPEPDNEQLRRAHESLRKQHEHLQQLYGRQSNELGRLREKLKPKPTQEDFDSDPVKATEQMAEHQSQVKHIESVEQEQQIREVVMQNIQFAQQHAPDLEANAQVIYDLMVNEDKVAPTEANAFLGKIFLQNPWGVFQLNQRARAYRQVQALQRQIEELKQAPKKVINNISKVNQSIPGISASTGHSALVDVGEGITDPDQLAKLSDKDLETALMAGIKKGK